MNISSGHSAWHIIIAADCYHCIQQVHNKCSFTSLLPKSGLRPRWGGAQALEQPRDFHICLEVSRIFSFSPGCPSPPDLGPFGFLELDVCFVQSTPHTGPLGTEPVLGDTRSRRDTAGCGPGAMFGSGAYQGRTGTGLGVCL